MYTKTKSNLLMSCLIAMFSGCGGNENTNSTIEDKTLNSSPAYVATKHTSEGKIIIGTSNGLATTSISRSTIISGKNMPNIYSNENTLRSNSDTAHREVYALTYQKDGKLLIGGKFNYVNGNLRNSIVRLNADGTVDKDFLDSNNGLNGEVYDIKVTNNNDIYIGGYFTAYNSIENVNGLVKINNDGNSLDTIKSLSSNYKLAVVNDIEFMDGLIILGGLFVDHADKESGIIVLNALDNTINKLMTDRLQVTGQVFDTCIANNSIYVGGKFKENINNSQKANIAIFQKNGDISKDNDTLPNINGYVYDIQINDATTYIAGDFMYKVKAENHDNLLVIKSDNKIAETQLGLKEKIYSISFFDNAIYLLSDSGLIKKYKKDIL